MQQKLYKLFPEIKFIKEEIDVPIKETRNSFQELARQIVPADKIQLIPKSFDRIGRIIITEIHYNLQPHAENLARLLLELTPNVISVYSKASTIEGIFRTRKFQFLAGINDPLTIHKENHCQFALDITKVYFNPRLSTERERISSIVSPSEVVLDLFAGVGPFSIQLARKGAIVHANDVNPQAIKWLKENCKINKVEDRVVVHQSDAKELISPALESKFDLVVMNLPKNSLNYLDIASRALKQNKGRILFYYEVNERDDIELLKEKMKQGIQKSRKNDIKFHSVKKILNIAPYRWLTCFEIHIL